MPDENKEVAVEAAPTTDTGIDSATEVANDIQDIFDYDPFPGGEEPLAPDDGTVKDPAGEAEADPAVTVPDEGQTADGGTDGSQPATTPEAPKENVMDPTIVKLLEDQNRLVEATVAATQPKEAAGETPAEPDPWKDIPDYTFDIPDNLMVAMDSEDAAERKMGIVALAKGIAGGIHREMMANISKVMPNQDNTIGMIQQVIVARETAAATRKDFYGTYEVFDKPALYPLIKEIGGQAAKDLGKDVWDAELRDEVAKRASAQLGIALPDPVAIVAEPAEPLDPPPAIGGGGNSRPSTPVVGGKSPNGSDAIMDTLIDF